MAATLRLMRYGKKGHPFYRIVVLDRTRKRDGSYIEAIGTYDPMSKPHKLELKADRLQYWLGVGAIASEGLKKMGIGKKK